MYYKSEKYVFMVPDTPFCHLSGPGLKISKFGGLRANIWAKIDAVKAKISKFSQKAL